MLLFLLLLLLLFLIGGLKFWEKDQRVDTPLITSYEGALELNMTDH